MSGSGERLASDALWELLVKDLIGDFMNDAPGKRLASDAADGTPLWKLLLKDLKRAR